MTWTATGDVGDEVKLELWKGGALERVMAYVVATADGTFTWPVPLDVAAGADYTVKVYSRTDLSIADVSDAAFEIVHPGIEVTAPNGGETWNTLGVETISWSTTGDVGDEVKLELWQGGALERVIAWTVPAADGSYAWTVPGDVAAADDYQVKVYSRSNVSIGDLSDGAFSVAESGVQVTAPNGGESWRTGDTQTVTWTTAGAAGASLELQLWKGGAFARTLASAVDAGLGAYDWTLPYNLTAGADYQVRAACIDQPSLTDLSDGVFTVTHPTLTVSAPGNGDTWYVGSTYDIAWSADGDIGPEVKIELLKGGALERVVEWTVAVDASPLPLTIPADVAEGSDYQIKVYSRANVAIAGTSDGTFSVVQPGDRGDVARGGRGVVPRERLRHRLDGNGRGRRRSEARVVEGRRAGAGHRLGGADVEEPLFVDRSHRCGGRQRLPGEGVFAVGHEHRGDERCVHHRRAEHHGDCAERRGKRGSPAARRPSRGRPWATRTTK